MTVCICVRCHDLTDFIRVCDSCDIDYVTPHMRRKLFSTHPCMAKLA